MNPWVYFWFFDPLLGSKNKKVKGTFRISSHPVHPENTPAGYMENASADNTGNVSADYPIKAKAKKRRKRLAEWGKRFDHPQKSGWYIFTAILCTLAALLSLCLGWLGLIPFVIFALGVWANIAYYLNFKKNDKA